MGEIIVHCGLHKTGSSAIQGALRNLDMPSHQYLHSGYSELINLEPSGQWVEDVRRMSTRKTIVVSSEAALGSMMDIYQACSEYSHRIAEAFDGLAYRLIVYVRPQLPWLESLYSQRVQQGEALSIESFLETTLDQPNLRWSHLAEAVQSALGEERVEFRPYDSKDVVLDFFKSAGLIKGNDESLTGRRANTSMTPARICAMRILNEHLTPSEAKQLRKFLQAGVPPRPASEKQSVFPPDVQAMILENFKDDWEQMLPTFLRARDVDEARVRAVWSNSAENRPFRQVGQDVADETVVSELLHIVRHSASSYGQHKKREISLARYLINDPIGFFRNASRRIARAMGLSRFMEPR